MGKKTLYLLMSFSVSLWGNEFDVSSLTSNPSNALKKMQKTYTKFAENFPDEQDQDQLRGKDWASFYRLKAEQQKCPLFLLDECTTYNNGSCLLSRLKKPEFRKAYEAKAVSMILEKIDTLCPLKEVNVTAFGSGEAFQELVILCKVLSERPNASLDVHLIDREYTPYVVCKKISSGSSMVSRDSYIHIESEVSKIIKYARENLGGKELTDDEIVNLLHENCAVIETRFQQFLSYLNCVFPRSFVCLYLHDELNSFVTDMQRGTIDCPDVVVAADIDDEMSRAKGAQESYITLCHQVLQRNQGAKNVWLKRERQEAVLTTISMKNQLTNQNDDDDNDESSGGVILDREIIKEKKGISKLFG